MTPLRGGIARRPNLKAHTVILQRITPVWVPPWSSGSIAPSCSAKVLMSYRHAIAISTQADTGPDSQVVILFSHIQYILPISETNSKPETIGHFLSKTKTH